MLDLTGAAGMFRVKWYEVTTGKKLDGPTVEGGARRELGTPPFTGDVDQEDFGLFQACLSVPGRPYDPGCEDADLDGDNDVDQADCKIFIGCMSGANQPPDPDCTR